MTTSHNTNPYAPSGTTNSPVQAARRWPVAVVSCVAVYYLLSASTLPFVNDVWFGEVPLLVLLQLPKAFLKGIVHSVLMAVMNGLGWSHGSFSPDFIATHGWAMGIMTTAPALLLIVVLTRLRRLPQRYRLISLLVFCATIDAVVTLLFDHVSSLKLYNASYF